MTELTPEEMAYWGSVENFQHHTHCGDGSGPVYPHNYVKGLSDKIKALQEKEKVIDKIVSATKDQFATAIILLHKLLPIAEEWSCTRDDRNAVTETRKFLSDER